MEDVHMSTNPFAIEVVVSGQGRKLFEQLSGLTAEQAQELLEGGYFTALRDAKRAGTLPALVQVRDFLMGRRTLAIAAAPYWTVWKTIKIGTGIKDGTSFCQKLEESDCQFGGFVRNLLGQKGFTVAAQEEEVDLVRCFVADFGFTESTCYDVICGRAIGMGLELCPEEVGPQLRLQYIDQPCGEGLLIAMIPIISSVPSVEVFVVQHQVGHGLWLSSDYGRSDYPRDPFEQVVFRLPRKQTLVT
jgi:hypothetical protein